MANSTTGSINESTASVNDVCETCGSIITMSGTQKHTHTHKSAASTAPAKAIAKARKPRRTPDMLRSKKMRTEVKVEMLAAVPGVSPAKATAVLEECENSFAKLVGASSTEIARCVYKGAPLGPDIGIAIWRALH